MEFELDPKKDTKDKKVGEKSSFYVRDKSQFEDDPNDPNAKAYAGQERRRRNRRGQKERREEVRFELDKEDRRQLSGRRKEDKVPGFW